MTSHTTGSFRRLLRRLPEPVRRPARGAFRLFCVDPRHPSLNLEKLRGFENLWSARVSLKFRAVAARENDVFVRFWIGSHVDFDSDFG